MLPKNSRIPRKDFPNLLEDSSFFHSPHFTLRVAHSTRPQIAVTVSKKISKKATTRNNIRRRSYGVLHKYLKTLKPRMMLFVAKPGSDKLRGESLENEIKELLSYSGLVDQQ